MALTKVINDLADLNQSGSTNALKGCAGTTAEQPASSSTIEYLIVGGGGGAGGGTLNSWGGGGGGAGGYLTGSTTVYQGIPAMLTIGEGGNGNNIRTAPGFNGDDSGFNGIRAVGGGGGGAEGVTGTGQSAVDGGSGGGAGGSTSSGTPSYAGLGVSGQGNAGGAANTSVRSAAGGGGAGAVGDSPSTGLTGADGGVGVNINGFITNVAPTYYAATAGIGEISGSDVYVAGGGGGAADFNTGGTGGAGGNGGGGAGGTDGTNSGNGISGTTNTGGGGGGGNADPSTQALGGSGGSGVAVLKYDNTIVTGYTLNSEDTYTVNWPADKYGVAYWPLNLDVKDVGGNYDGTATDVTYVTGKFNQAASFNGSSSKIDVGSGLNNSTFTVSVWFKTSYSGGTQTLINNGGQNSGETGYFLGILASGYYRFGTSASGSGSLTVDGTVALNNDTWHHIVVSYTAIGIGSSIYNIYVDGVNVSSGSNGTFTGKATRPTWIGQFSYTVSSIDFMNGEIEQIRFYASALSSSDVQDIYNNSKPGSLPPLKTSSDLTTTTCNYPSGTTGTALYQFQGNADDSCTTPVAYDLTEVGSPSYVTGKFGTAIQFNGTSQGVTSTSAVIPTPAATISLWFNGNGTASTEFYIIGVGVGGSSYGLDIHYYNDGSGGHFYGGVVDGGSFQGVGTGDTIVDTNTWYHLALTWDGSTTSNSMKLYLNGILETNITPTVTAASLTYSSFGIGKTATSTYAPGIVDQVRIYGSVLTSQEIYDLWQKENNIQTYFSMGPSDTPANTDILVFKEGSGEITFKNDSPPGAEVGMLRYNTTLGQMEHFNSGGWKDFTDCTTSICNYPTTTTALYQFNYNPNPTCTGPSPTTTSNLTYADGIFGQSVNFNGSDSVWQSTSQIIDSQSSFTISMWIKMDAYNGNSQYLWTSYATGDWGISFTNKAPLDRYVSFHKWNNTQPGTSVAIDAPDVTELGQWYHVCGTFSTTTGMVLYINGVSVAQDSTTWTGYNHGAYSDSIGCYGGTWTGPRANFTGQIDQFRAFQSSLTSDQVTQLYNEVYCP